MTNVGKASEERLTVRGIRPDTDAQVLGRLPSDLSPGGRGRVKQAKGGGRKRRPRQREQREQKGPWGGKGTAQGKELKEVIRVENRGRGCGWRMVGGEKGQQPGPCRPCHTDKV